MTRQQYTPLNWNWRQPGLLHLHLFSCILRAGNGNDDYDDRPMNPRVEREIGSSSWIAVMNQWYIAYARISTFHHTHINQPLLASNRPPSPSGRPPRYPTSPRPSGCTTARGNPPSSPCCRDTSPPACCCCWRLLRCRRGAGNVLELARCLGARRVLDKRRVGGEERGIDVVNG